MQHVRIELCVFIFAKDRRASSGRRPSAASRGPWASPERRGTSPPAGRVLKQRLTGALPRKLAGTRAAGDTRRKGQDGLAWIRRAARAWPGRGRRSEEGCGLAGVDPRSRASMAAPRPTVGGRLGAGRGQAKGAGGRGVAAPSDFEGGRADSGADAEGRRPQTCSARRDWTDPLARELGTARGIRADVFRRPRLDRPPSSGPEGRGRRKHRDSWHPRGAGRPCSRGGPPDVRLAACLRAIGGADRSCSPGGPPSGARHVHARLTRGWGGAEQRGARVPCGRRRAVDRSARGPERRARAWDASGGGGGRRVFGVEGGHQPPRFRARSARPQGDRAAPERVVAGAVAFLFRAARRRLLEPARRHGAGLSR